jgi:hypothetical protein
VRAKRKDEYMSVGVMKDYKRKLRKLIDEKFANAMGEYVT